jgi:hypothetical protein
MATTVTLISANGKLKNKVEMKYSSSTTDGVISENGLIYGSTNIPAQQLGLVKSSLQGALTGYTETFSGIPAGTWYIGTYCIVNGTIYYSQMRSVRVFDRGYELSNEGVTIATPMIIANGTEYSNRVLTSDPTGNTSWKDISAFYSSKRYIGELYGGGVVADIWNEAGEEVVLISSLDDLSSIDGIYNPSVTSEGTILNRFTAWIYSKGSPSQSNYIGTSSQSNYDGQRNTRSIIEFSYSVSATGSAAQVASSYRGGGYDDWYLPSYYEMNSIYKNANTISKSLNSGFIFPMRDGRLSVQNYEGLQYLSSTEVSINQSTTAAYQISLFGPVINAKLFKKRIKAVRKEYSKAGGPILSLDATKEDSFSENAYRTYGTVSRWACLVNQNISASYSFSLISKGAASGTAQISSPNNIWSSLGSSTSTTGKIGTYNLYGVNTTTSRARILSSTASIITDYFSVSKNEARFELMAIDDSSTRNGYSGSIRIYVSVKYTDGRTSPYHMLKEINPSSALTWYYIPIWQYSNTQVSLKIEAPNAFFNSASIFGGPGISNLQFSGYSTYRPIGPLFIPEQGGLLRFSTTQSGVVSAATGSYIDFSAPVGNSTTVTVEMWARIRNSQNPTMMLFGWNAYNVWYNYGDIGFNTVVGDLYGISNTVTNSLEIPNNWTHFVFEMKAGSEIGPTFSLMANNKMYINGERQTISRIYGVPGSDLGAPTASRMNFNGGSGRIGGYRSSPTYLTNMDVSVFRVYNRTLSKDDIMLNFESERKRYELLPKVHKDDLWVNIDFNNTSSYSGTGMSNETMTDLSGKGNNASITVGTTLPTAYNSGTAFPLNKRIVFPGTTSSNALITIPDGGVTGELRNSATFSVCLWVKFNQSRESSIISKWQTSGGSAPLWTIKQVVYGAGSAIGISIKQGSEYTVVTGTTLIPNGKWTHVCMTYNDITKNIKSYIDSVPDLSVTTAFRSAAIGTGAVYVGEYPSSFGAQWYPMHGEIANLQIYTRDITKIEVVNIFNVQNFRFDSSMAPIYGDSHLSTGATLSIYQNLALDIPGRYADRILVSRSSGEAVWADKRYVFPEKKEKKRRIGDLYGGGIIVGAWKYPSTTNKYLIMSLTDLTTDTGVVFSNINASASSAYSEYDGITNTATIIAQTGHSNSAAKLCTDYVSNGYSDWYLPSTQEMMMAFNAGAIIGYVLSKNDFAEYGFNVPRGIYWTSTQPRDDQPLSSSFSIAFNIGNLSPKLVFHYEKNLNASVRAFRLASEEEENIKWNDEWDPSHVPIDWKIPSWATKVSLDPNFKFLFSPDGYDTNPIGSGTISTVAQRGFAAFTFSNVISTTEAIISAGVCWATSSTYPIVPTIDSNVAYAVPPYSVVETSPILGNPVGYLATDAQAQEVRKIFQIDVPNTIDKITGNPETPFRIFIRAFVRTQSGYYYSKDTSRVILASKSVNGGLLPSIPVVQEISAATYSANGIAYTYPEGVMSYIHPYYYYNRN